MGKLKKNLGDQLVEAVFGTAPGAAAARAVMDGAAVHPCPPRFFPEEFHLTVDGVPACTTDLTHEQLCQGVGCSASLRSTVERWRQVLVEANPTAQVLIVAGPCPHYDAAVKLAERHFHR